MKAVKLPSAARCFLRQEEYKSHEAIVRRFHGWMAAKQVLLLALEPEEVESFFVAPLRSTASPRASQLYKRHLIVYLDWLWENGHLDFDPKVLGIRHRRPLPEIAKQYLRSLEATLKKSTCAQHAGAVSRFHDWLAVVGVGHKRLKRAKTELLILSFSDEGLHPSTRRTILCGLRRYLRWLSERGELIADPDELVRSTDMPKLPAYLPRPLSPLQDQALQENLQGSSNPLHLALLLMRLTGLRVGELRTLTGGCLHPDPKGNVFLKVPLGKLDTERLVPVDDKVVGLVEALRQSELSGGDTFLLAIDDKPIPYPAYQDALAQACQEIVTSEKITSHRLRHTYATSMLSAGVSLTSLMMLLGHKDVRMTLRYAAITQETIREEYQAAQIEIATRYQQAIGPQADTIFDPAKSLADVDHWIQTHLAHAPENVKLSRSLQKRLRRIRDDMQRVRSMLE